MDWVPLSANAARQAIDSFAIFDEWRRATAVMCQFEGGMYFKREGSYEYLVKTSPDKRQQRLGRRTPETEAVLESYKRKKRTAEERRTLLAEGMREAVRLNRALRVGRMPRIVGSVLSALEHASPGSNILLVGTPALYAYETAAAVRIAPSALGGEEVDLLWDEPKRIQFMTNVPTLPGSVLAALQRFEPTFRLWVDQSGATVEAKGSQVRLLRGEASDVDQHSVCSIESDDDRWLVSSRCLEVLRSAPPFQQTVISGSGQMALMRTLDPMVFVEMMRWMARLPKRDPIKCRRDEMRAAIVSRLLDEGLLASKA